VPKQCTVKIECVLNEEGHGSIYEVWPTLTVGEVKENFNFKHVNFRCVESETGSNINQAIDLGSRSCNNKNHRCISNTNGRRKRACQKENIKVGHCFVSVNIKLQRNGKY